MSRISFLGDKYTHTYAAARKVMCDGDELIGFHTIYESILAATNGNSDYAIAPIENSCGGSIADTLDALWTLPLYITKETVLSVPQNLIGIAGTEKRDIEVIYSHPQAISQCNDYLRRYFEKADVIAVSSTAQALSLVKDGRTAAIARVAGEGQTVIDGEIEDVKNNATRFVLLSGEPTDVGGKCSVVFETRNKPGALVDVLGVLRSFGLNMSKIESRPHKSMLGRYVFFVDFDFDGTDGELTEVLGALTRTTLALKFLGRYGSV